MQTLCLRKKILQISGLKKIHAPKIFHPQPYPPPPSVISNGPSLNDLIQEPITQRLLSNIFICTRNSNAKRRSRVTPADLVGHVAVKITNNKVVALSKLTMGCRRRKLSLSFL